MAKKKRFEVRSDNNFRRYICDTTKLNDLPFKNGAISLTKAVDLLNHYSNWANWAKER